jgi:hypothetical protein
MHLSERCENTGSQSRTSAIYLPKSCDGVMVLFDPETFAVAGTSHAPDFSWLRRAVPTGVIAHPNAGETIALQSR